MKHEEEGEEDMKGSGRKGRNMEREQVKGEEYSDEGNVSPLPFF